jgi:hypothetical protein
MTLNNPEYDDEVMLMLQIAKESETFRVLLEGMVKDTDSECPTNQAWLGTLALGKGKTHTQVKLVVTQDVNKTIDED